MKQLKRKINSMIGMIILLFTVLLTGCENKRPFDGDYEVRFAVNAMSIEKPVYSKSSNLFAGAFAIDPAEVTHVRIGIDGTELPVMTYNVNIGVTDPIKLSTGNHTLTSMSLLKETTPGVYEVMYSAVATGAPLSQYVTHTLPITFEIPLMNMEYVNVDVIALDDWTPEDFGWGSFNIGITTVYPLYFYGADDLGNQSVMSMQIFEGNTLLSASETTVQGWTKVYYPDYNNRTGETYRFRLIKDGKTYERMWTVEELIALPKEVHLLNVYGSGMMGFGELIYLTSVSFNIPNPFAQPSEMFGFDVRNSGGTVIYSSELSQGAKTFQYVDTPMDDNSEYYDITLRYQLFNSGPGTWGLTQTRVAHVNVATLKSMTTLIEMGIYASNYWWEFI